jgi:hypothetical protein
MRFLAIPMLLSALSGATGWAQVSVPFLGYFPDGGRIRPVRGIASSSSVARPIETGVEFARVASAPGGEFLLVTAAGSGEVSIFRPARGITPLAGAGASPDLIVFSPGGGAAALWFSAVKRVQIVKGLPGAPEIREIDTAFLGEAPEALAVSDGGDWIVGAWADGLHAFGPRGEANWLPVTGARRALGFFHGSHDLAVAAPRGVFRVIDIGGRAELRLLMAAEESPLEALAAGVAAGNRRVAVVEAGGRIATVETETGVARSVDCRCAPEGLFGVSRSVFRLTGLKDGAFLLFDAETGEVLFAPVTAEEGGRQ